MTARQIGRVSFIYLYPSSVVRRARARMRGIKSAEFWRCTVRVWVSRGGHLSSEVCADSITGEKTERARERTNERPALSKDKGGNSPRQIIEWPDSASLFLFPSLSFFLSPFAPILLHLDLLPFLFCAYRTI